MADTQSVTQTDIESLARLLTAAPEMLAALKHFVADHEASGFYCAGLNAAFMDAKRAIALAEKGV